MSEGANPGAGQLAGISIGSFVPGSSMEAPQG